MGIDQVARGRTPLACPYCRTPLIAKKGRILSPHFAHDGPTCRESAERHAARIPFYDELETLGPLGRSDLKLSAALVGQTINETSFRGWRRAALRRLIEAEILEEVSRGERWVNGIGSHRHSAWGTLVVRAFRGRLTLAELGSVQERAVLQKLADLERRAAEPRDVAVVTDLRLYRAQLARVVSLDLYLIRAELDGRVLHKIGVTARSVDERLPEIRADLAEHFDQIDLDVQGVWQRRGSLELYFKRLFASRRVRIGTLTEYFSFDERASGGKLHRRPLTMLAKLEPWKLPPELSRLVGG